VSCSLQNLVLPTSAPRTYGTSIPTLIMSTVGVKRTSPIEGVACAFDPKQTYARSLT